MTTYPQLLNEDGNGRKTSAKYGDRGDGTDDWHLFVRVAAGIVVDDGGDETIGAKGDAAVTNPASSASVVAILKGILSAVHAEDVAHVSGDIGIQALGVRKDTPAATAGTTGDYQPETFDALGAQWVHPVQSAVTIEVDSAGLTTATTAYTSGDQTGTEMTFAGAGSVTGWGGLIVAAVILDKAQKINTGDFELWLFDRSVTGAGDNAAAEWSDADMAHCVGRIKWLTADWVNFSTTNSHNQQTGLAIPYTCAATSLFGTLVTRQGNAFYTAATDLRVSLRVLRD